MLEIERSHRPQRRVGSGTEDRQRGLRLGPPDDAAGTERLDLRLGVPELGKDHPRVLTHEACRADLLGTHRKRDDRAVAQVSTEERVLDLEDEAVLPYRFT